MDKLNKALAEMDTLVKTIIHNLMLPIQRL
jgi:hypothetical protein